VVGELRPRRVCVLQMLVLSPPSRNVGSRRGADARYGVIPSTIPLPDPSDHVGSIPHAS